MHFSITDLETIRKCLIFSIDRCDYPSDVSDLDMHSIVKSIETHLEKNAVYKLLRQTQIQS